MRRVTVLIGFASFVLVSSARAQEAAAPAPESPPPTATAEAPAPAAGESKMQVGVAFLPMALGKMTASVGGESVSVDAAMAYGLGVSFGYNVIPGLSVGVAPQAIFNVKAKDGDQSAAKEYDLMARVAYAYPVAPKFTAYGEFLPGYSIITIPNVDDNAKGLVLAFGVGGTMDINDQLFVNLGVGYQIGFQKVSDNDLKTKALRIAVGVGMRL